MNINLQSSKKVRNLFIVLFFLAGSIFLYCGVPRVNAGCSGECYGDFGKKGVAVDAGSTATMECCKCSTSSCGNVKCTCKPTLCPSANNICQGQSCTYKKSDCSTVTVSGTKCCTSCTGIDYYTAWGACVNGVQYGINPHYYTNWCASCPNATVPSMACSFTCAGSIPSGSISCGDPVANNPIAWAYVGTSSTSCTNTRNCEYYTPPPACVPNCSCASNTCSGNTCSDGCGGTCSGTKTCCVPNCNNSANVCIGSTYNDGCGGTCSGTKNCATIITPGAKCGSANLTFVSGGYASLTESQKCSAGGSMEGAGLTVCMDYFPPPKDCFEWSCGSASSGWVRCMAGTEYHCTGVLPAGATPCTGDDTGYFVFPTAWAQAKNNTCTTRKCEYTMPSYTCTGGNPPQGAIWCTDDNTGLTADTTWAQAVGNICTDTRKCEYTMPAVNNGDCGQTDGQTYFDQPSSNLCDTGNVNWIDQSASDGIWNWECEGLNGGINMSCSATKQGLPTATTTVNTDTNIGSDGRMIETRP